MTAVYYAWTSGLVGGLVLAAAASCWAVRRAARWAGSLRWQKSTTTLPDWSDVLDVWDAAEDLTRQAANGENWWA